MEGVFGTLRKGLTDALARRRDRPLLEAAMAASALVAMADREVRLSEQLALDHVLERIERLSVFDPHTAVDLHKRYAEELRDD